MDTINRTACSYAHSIVRGASYYTVKPRIEAPGFYQYTPSHQFSVYFDVWTVPRKPFILTAV